MLKAMPSACLKCAAEKASNFSEMSSARLAGTPLMQEVERRGLEPNEFRKQIEHEVRYANIAIIKGNDASQYGIGMVAARIAQAVIRDERVAIPIGSHQARYGVTLSLPSIVGRQGVVAVIEPDLSGEERRALERGAERVKQAPRDPALS
jgi:L-lactate dehydrogenase